jgi:hypothetical protein
VTANSEETSSKETSETINMIDLSVKCFHDENCLACSFSSRSNFSPTACLAIILNIIHHFGQKCIHLELVVKIFLYGDSVNFSHH